jgi:hypothetical protein
LIVPLRGIHDSTSCTVYLSHSWDPTDNIISVLLTAIRYPKQRSPSSESPSTRSEKCHRSCQAVKRYTVISSLCNHCCQDYANTSSTSDNPRQFS